jgi:multiple sugar transport system ATP-binding protein
VAGFIGSPAMNLLTLDVDNGHARLGSLDVPLERHVAAQITDATIVLGVRPEAWVVAGAGAPVEVDVVEELGADEFVYGRLSAGTSLLPVVARYTGHQTPAKGDVVHLQPNPTKLHWFSSSTGERLN